MPDVVVIPATITVGTDVYNVTEIGDNAFKDRTGLTSITIPNSVTTIGDFAFYECVSLTSITIPDSVTYLGEYAFYNCTSLTGITVPDSLTTIGDYAFYNCTSLTGITISDSVITIGDFAFYNCTSLTGITIPDSVTTMGDYAFFNCSSLTSVTIPDSVTTIGTNVFAQCTSLTSIIIPDSVTTIGNQAFVGCYRLTSIIIPDSVTTIGDYAFAGCSSLTSITVPDSLTTIGDYAFGSCSSLTSITIPSSVIKVGQYSFQYCHNLTAITFEGTTPPTFGVQTFSFSLKLTTINVPLGSEAAYNRALPDYAGMIEKSIFSYSAASGSSGVPGSSTPDKSANAGSKTAGTTVGKLLTKAEATQQFASALAAKPAGETTLSIKVKNSTSVSKEVLAELVALAKKNGVNLTVHFDTVIGGKVVGRLSVNPATATGDLNVAITENKALAARIAKFFSNPLAAYTIPAAGSVAIKLPENLKPEDLVIYSYDKTTNIYAQLQNAKPRVDKNGYLHFDIAASTDVVISQGKLVKK